VLAGRRFPVLWNIRTNRLVPGVHKRTLIWTARLCAKLSKRVPYKIIVNSHSGLEWHKGFGYASEKLVRIPNGFDTERFRPSLQARKLLRRELRVPETERLVGMVGRVQPQKDHRTFLDAAALLVRWFHDVTFILCGSGTSWDNEPLRRMIEERGLSQRVRLLGVRTDMPIVQAALDVAVLASHVEAFPNVVGEAMLCGVPCVVTDVGDSRELLADHRLLVPPREPELLAQRCREILQMPKAEYLELGMQCRRFIQNRFSLETIVARYVELWSEAVEASRLTPARAA